MGLRKEGLNYKPEYLIEKGTLRVKSMPKRIAEERVFVQGNPIAASVTTLVWGIALRNRNIRGLKHFDRAVEAYSEENPLTMIGPHLSDADTLYVEQSARKTGRSRIAGRFTYITGENMDERLPIKINTQGSDRIFIETPLVVEDLEEILKSGKPEYNDLLLEHGNLFQEHLKWANKLVKAALREVVNARRRKGILVVYPQSTRSPDGLIKRGHPATEAYLKKGIILPFMVRGSERFMPPHQQFPFWERIRDGWTVDLEYGPAFYAKSLWLPETVEGLKEMGANPVDLAMAQVGSLDWNRVDPKIRLFHQKIADECPVVRLAA